MHLDTYIWDGQTNGNTLKFQRNVFEYVIGPHLTVIRTWIYEIETRTSFELVPKGCLSLLQLNYSPIFVLMMVETMQSQTIFLKCTNNCSIIILKFGDTGGQIRCSTSLNSFSCQSVTTLPVWIGAYPPNILHLQLGKSSKKTLNLTR